MTLRPLYLFTYEYFAIAWLLTYVDIPFLLSSLNDYDIKIYMHRTVYFWYWLI